MQTVRLTRTSTGDQGTFGNVTIDGLTQKWISGELPVRDNIPDAGCIDSGSFRIDVALSPHFQSLLPQGVYHVRNTPGRTNILIHPANWMGDASKGFQCQLEGCIALGMTLGSLNGQQALVSSRTAISQFMAALQSQPATLVIVNAF